MKSLRTTFLALLLGVVLVFPFYKPTSALYLSQRSVNVSLQQAGAVTSHTFTFNIPSSAAVGSMQFEYCTNSPIITASCSAPGGMDMQAATIATQTGTTGFSMSPSSTVNAIVITRASSAVVPGPAQYIFSNVTNPSNVNSTIFVRITTYASIDATGAVIDQGSVAFSTSGNLGTAGYVPPYISACAAVTVAADCTSIGDQLVTFGEFSSSSTAKQTSQFAVATNDPTGYNMFLSGQTMTAGNLIIPALTGGASQTGQSQFGLNLRLNTSPSVGADPSGVGSGVADVGYGTPNSYRFVSGERIAYSPLPTDFNRFTVSYIVNISPTQGPGFYGTTMTYTAVVNF